MIWHQHNPQSLNHDTYLKILPSLSSPKNQSQKNFSTSALHPWRATPQSPSTAITEPQTQEPNFSAPERPDSKTWNQISSQTAASPQSFPSENRNRSKNRSIPRLMPAESSLLRIQRTMGLISDWEASIRRKVAPNWKEASGWRGEERPLITPAIRWAGMNSRGSGGIAMDPPGIGRWGRIATLIRIRRGFPRIPKTCPKAVHLRYSKFINLQTPIAVCPL